jgi:N-carbamoylputrescine amidase
VSRDGDPDGNLARAARLVGEARERGADLVVCPEFLATRYTYDESIWTLGEPREGRTVTWLRRLAKEHRLHIGATYLESDGADFFNTFTLAAPDGSVVGRVRKESLPFFEGWFFKSCTQGKVIDTTLGRIAVGICNDNYTMRFFQRMMSDEPDLIVMPHSAPCIPPAAGLMRTGLAEIAPHYARAFGVPVVLVNKAASRSRSPVPGIPFVRLPFEFPGMSTISDAHGSVIAQLPDREGVIVEDVLLNPANKRRPAMLSATARAIGAFFVVMEQLGKRAYARNPRRPIAARELASARHAASSSAALSSST